MREVMAYEEFLKEVKKGILTPSGNCPLAPLLVMLQGNINIAFTEKGRDLMPVFYAMMNWGFQYEADNEKITQE